MGPQPGLRAPRKRVMPGRQLASTGAAPGTDGTNTGCISAHRVGATAGLPRRAMDKLLPTACH